MAHIPPRAIALFVPDAETESKWLLAVTQITVKAYRRAHLIPRLSPTPHDALEHLPTKGLA